jgi:hypothetical protein
MVKVTSSFKMFYDETETLSKSQIRQLQIYGLKGFKKNVTKSQFQIYLTHQHSFTRFGIQWYMRQKYDGEYIITRDRDMLMEEWEKTHTKRHSKVRFQLKGDFEFKYGKAELSELFVVKKV